MITSIAFTVYPVSNMERARAFYEPTEMCGRNMTLAMRPSPSQRQRWAILPEQKEPSWRWRYQTSMPLSTS